MNIHTRIFNAFFVRDRLIDTFKILCMSKAVTENDCLTSIMTQLCTSSISVKFTDQGYVPFEKQPLLLIPYSYMSKEQIQIIQATILNMQAGTIQYKVSSMMGGGISIVLLEPPTLKVNPEDILVTLYTILSQKSRCDASHKMIYNAIVQRLICNINLPRVHIEAARKLILASRKDENNQNSENSEILPHTSTLQH